MTKLEKIIYIFENANIEGLCEPEYNEMMEWFNKLKDISVNWGDYDNTTTLSELLKEKTINGAI
jgi:hypothetical protein